MVYGAINSVEDGTTIIMARNGVLNNLIIRLTAAPGGTNSRLFTVRVNGVPTPLTFTFTSATMTVGPIIAPVPVVIGDRVSLETRTLGTTPAAARATASITY